MIPTSLLLEAAARLATFDHLNSIAEFSTVEDDFSKQVTLGR